MSKAIIIAFFVSVAGLVLFGCDGGGGGGGAAGVDVTGSWSGDGFSTTLVQTGNSVSGTAYEPGASGAIAGTVSGNQVSATITWSGDPSDRTVITATVSGDTMSVSWHYILTGESGSFVLTRD